MKLLQLALSTLGYGETLMGLSLADQLEPAGVESYFVASPISETVIDRRNRQYQILDRRMGPLARLVIDDVVEQFEPDAIVLADYLTFSGVFDTYYGLDPWFVEEYDLPILPIDIWEWENTSFVLDMPGDEPHEIDKRILDMDAHLRPVPLAHVDAGGTGRGFPYRLWGESEKISRRTRSHLLMTFGLKPTDRLVLLTVAPWQQLESQRYRSTIGRMAGEVPRLLAHYLEQLPDNTHFLFIGKVPPALAGLPADRTITIPPCSPKRFGALLGLADLVLSLNIGATTVARAILADIPAMVLTNSHTAEGEAEIDRLDADLGGLTPGVRAWLDEVGLVYPFHMWPLGFSSFLEPLLTDNPYTGAIAQAELLDEKAVVAGMTDLLYDTGTKRRYADARATYQRSVAQLPPTPDVFAAAARRVGLTL